ncbi:CDP-diacylglycerol-glycerol-3-phosphate 3-phosphatidyltransferase [Lathyrus oleraceus]|uniref:CDP-diacylglycerol-glycerol-3-phosphate 3-phosphatidyltransferase n=1 Tax=Pisum sativum TaxID=3888 RepID=A0A9D4Y360_PEA|nr:CDP-diacylglycerol-glycerol-3-phosphate 3-phosphatidyltransferase [Pisum sativum]
MDGWQGTAITTSIFTAAAITDWLDGYIARKMKLKSSFGAFLDPVADKLMVAATLILLCTRPVKVAALAHAPWLLIIPSIIIIGREVGVSEEMHAHIFPAHNGSPQYYSAVRTNFKNNPPSTVCELVTVCFGSGGGSTSSLAYIFCSYCFLIFIRSCYFSNSASNSLKSDILHHRLSVGAIGKITMSALREWAASQGSKTLEAVAVNSLGKWKTATQMTALTILLATRDCSHGGPAILAGSGVLLLYIAAGLAVWSFVVYMRKIWKVLVR